MISNQCASPEVKLEFHARVLDVSELEEVLQFEQMHIGEDPASVFAAWHAPWRRESLEHYLPKGWCFALRDSQNNLKAYFLAQPILFFQSLTQVLWVEHLSFENPDHLLQLIDLARRYARDKHLQKVIFNAASKSTSDLKTLGAIQTSENTFEFNTTKMDQR